MDYCWIAERGGINIGSILITNGGDGVAEAAASLYRQVGAGLASGKTLVGECIRFAKAKDTGRSRFGPASSCMPRTFIYLKAGFRLVAEERHRMFGPELNGQTWRYSISLICSIAKVSLDLETIIS